MSRARETGFYFEPMSERLALVVEGAPFPSDEHWAWVGDPVDITPDDARLECAVRWPGVDPELLHVELDMGMHALLAELEAKGAADGEPALLHPQPSPPDVNALLAQAQELERAVAQLGATEVTGAELAARAEALDLARAAASISAAARQGMANRELQQALAALDADERDEKK